MSDSQGAGRDQLVFPDKRKPCADGQRTVANRPATIAAARGPGKGTGGVAPKGREFAQTRRRFGTDGGRGPGCRVSPARRCCALGRGYGSLRCPVGRAGPTGGVGHFWRHEGPSGSPACALPGQLQQWAARCWLGRSLLGRGLRGLVPVPRALCLPLCPPLPAPDLAVCSAALRPSAFGLAEPGGRGKSTPGLRRSSAELPGG